MGMVKGVPGSNNNNKSLFKSDNLAAGWHRGKCYCLTASGRTLRVTVCVEFHLFSLWFFFQFSGFLPPPKNILLGGSDQDKVVTESECINE